MKSLTSVVIACLCFIVSSNDEKNMVIESSFITSHGLQIPKLGLGTAGLRSRTDEVVEAALKVGIRLIDSAQAREWYDESRVGTGINNYHNGVSASDSPNDKVVVVTKIHPRSFSDQKMYDAIIKSKNELYGSESAILDVVLLHSPHCWQGHCSREEESISWKEGWRNLEKIMADGHVSAIGVSNFDPNLLRELLRMSNAKVAVIQNWMDPFHQDRETRELCKENNIIYMSYSSFGTQWENKFNGENPVFSDETLTEIAAKHNTTISNVVISWLLQEDVVAIPRSSSVAHIEENASPMLKGKDMNGLKVFLDASDMEMIRGLDGFHGSLWD